MFDRLELEKLFLFFVSCFDNFHAFKLTTLRNPELVATMLLTFHIGLKFFESILWLVFIWAQIAAVPVR